jgi:hypothetical protein
MSSEENMNIDDPKSATNNDISDFNINEREENFKKSIDSKQREDFIQRILTNNAQTLQKRMEAKLEERWDIEVTSNRYHHCNTTVRMIVSFEM